MTTTTVGGRAAVMWDATQRDGRSLEPARAMGTSVTTSRSGSATRAAITRVGLVVFVALNAMSETMKFYNRDATSATAAAMATRANARVESWASGSGRDEPAVVRRALERPVVLEVDAPRRATSGDDDEDEDKGEKTPTTTTTTIVVEAEEKETTTVRDVNASTGEAASETPVATVSVRTRECGSPAVDGYAKVNLTCMASSATAREYDASESGREKLRAHIEPHASYDGIAVRWGIGHIANTAEECAEKCRTHPIKPNGTGTEMFPCNVFVWCPKGEGIEECFEPDAHTHSPGDCWLKFSETPESVEVNQRGANDASGFVNKDGATFAQRHPKAPKMVHWTSGVLVPEGTEVTPGTLGPRATW